MLTGQLAWKVWCATLLFFLSSAFADLQQSIIDVPDVVPNITGGHYRTGGKLALSSGSLSDGSSSKQASLRFPFEYFFWDRFSAGGLIDYSYLESTSTRGARQHSNLYLLGPSFSWFFWSQGRVATYLEPALLYLARPETTSPFFVQISLGLDYFVFSSVALGLDLQYQHQFSPGSQATGNAVQFAVGAQLFL